MRPETSPGTTMTDETDEKWAAYPETVLEFFDAAGRATTIDLRSPLDDAARRRLAALGLDRPFAVFTAQNPHGDNADDAESGRAAAAKDARNAARESRLERALREAGIAFRRVDGVAPDGSYREACVGAVMEREAAVRLATRLDQLALFWYDGGDFWLLPAKIDRSPLKLPPR